MEQFSNSIRGLRLLALVNFDRLIWPLAVLMSLSTWGYLSGL